MKNKSNVIDQSSYTFYGKVSDIYENIFYFTGVCSSADEFKNRVKAYYALEIDAVDAYSLRFNYISNVCRIDGVDDGKYINV